VHPLRSLHIGFPAFLGFLSAAVIAVSIFTSRVLVFFYVVMGFMWLVSIAMEGIRRRQEPLARAVLDSWLQVVAADLDGGGALTPRRPRHSSVNCRVDATLTVWSNASSAVTRRASTSDPSAAAS
jgi:hypothetical protein